jgi:hypothetical protein
LQLGEGERAIAGGEGRVQIDGLPKEVLRNRVVLGVGPAQMPRGNA